MMVVSFSELSGYGEVRTYLSSREHCKKALYTSFDLFVVEERWVCMMGSGFPWRQSSETMYVNLEMAYFACKVRTFFLQSEQRLDLRAVQDS